MRVQLSRGSKFVLTKAKSTVRVLTQPQLYFYIAEANLATHVVYTLRPFLLLFFLHGKSQVHYSSLKRWRYGSWKETAGKGLAVGKTWRIRLLNVQVGADSYRRVLAIMVFCCCCCFGGLLLFFAVSGAGIVALLFSGYIWVMKRKRRRKKDPV